MELLGLRVRRPVVAGGRTAGAGPGARPVAGATRKPRGQSLVEFAISFPVVMLMILFGVDFGRVFVGWLSLSNAVREAANYAAINPDAWTESNAQAIAEYERLISAEAGGTACALPDALPSPTFPSGYAVGQPVVVAVTCRFSLITPLIGNILGDAINVSAASSFPIRSGLLGGSGFSAGLPSFSPGATSGSGGGGGGGGESAAPTVTPIPTPSQIPTPVPQCQVPDLVTVNSSQATKKWTDKGFSANNLTFNPLVPPHFKIKSQSLTAGDFVVCTSTMTVTP